MSDLNMSPRKQPDRIRSELRRCRARAEVAHPAEALLVREADAAERMKDDVRAAILRLFPRPAELRKPAAARKRRA